MLRGGSCLVEVHVIAGSTVLLLDKVLLDKVLNKVPLYACEQMRAGHECVCVHCTQICV